MAPPLLPTARGPSVPMRSDELSQSWAAGGLPSADSVVSGRELLLDKKRTVVLLRSVVVISTSYLILFCEAPARGVSVAYVIALILSNVALTLTPKMWFRNPLFSAALLLTDTAVVLVGLYLTVGCFSQD